MTFLSGPDLKLNCPPDSCFHCAAAHLGKHLCERDPSRKSDHSEGSPALSSSRLRLGSSALTSTKLSG